MEKIIRMLMDKLRQERTWRLSDSECGGDEVNESLDMMEHSIRNEMADILKIGPYSDFIDLLIKGGK
jgi:hypothetical protein